MTVDKPIVPPIRAPLTETNGHEPESRTAARDWWLFFHQLQTAISNLATLGDQLSLRVDGLEENAGGGGAAGLTHPNAVTKVGASGEIVEGGMVDETVFGAESLHIAAGGNIGIATDTPQSNLHIHVASGANVVRQSVGSARGQMWYWDSVDYYLMFTEAGDPGGDSGALRPLVVNADTGYVGIGTSVPAYQLDVVGDCNIGGELTTGSIAGIGTAAPQGNLHVHASGVNIVRQTVGTTRGQLWYWDSVSYYLMFTASGDPGGGENGLRPFVVDATTGYVGMGTSAPGYQLDVVGDCNVGGNITAGSNLGIGTISPQGNLHVHAASAPSVIRQSVGASRGLLWYWDSVDYYLMFTAAGDPNGPDIGLRPFVAKAATGYVGMGTSSPTRQLDVVGDCNISGVFTTGSNAGIATASPQGALHVHVASGANILRQTVGSARGVMWYWDSADYYLMFTAAGDPNGGPNALRPIVVNAATGRVGMGISSPGYQLDIVSDCNSYGVYRVAGTQVVGPRGAAVAAASGGTTIDAQARTAINTVIARLQAHGLIT